MNYNTALPYFPSEDVDEIIKKIVGQLQGKEGVKLIDFYPDYDFNRTVIEVIGRPEPLKEALLNMAGKSYELIDMEKQSGRHPRIGAQDTIPLFPLKGIDLAECKSMAEEIGHILYERFEVPIFFSGENARTDDRKNLSFIRKGQYEGLKKEIHKPERSPDIGPAQMHPTAGATIVSSASTGLVAVNIILDSNDLEIAKSLALTVRGPSGGFSTIRAVGFELEDLKKVAVSMNMFDLNATPIHRVFNVIEMEAHRKGVQVIGTQIVGTLHNEVLIDAAAHHLRLVDFKQTQIIENHMINL